MRNPFKRRDRGQKALGSTGIRQTTHPTLTVPLVGESRSFNDLHKTVWAVQTVTGWLGRNLAAYSPAVFDRAPGQADKLRARDPLAAVLHAPLPGVSKYEFIRWLISSAALSGSSYAVIVSSGEKVRSLVPVPSHLVSFESSQADGEQDAYMLNLPTGEKRVARADMLHVRLFDPTSIYGGQSPIESLRDLIAEDVAAGKDRRRFYQNATRPYGVIERALEAPPWSNEAREAFRADWSAVMGGEGTGQPAGEFSTGILEDGMKFNAAERISPRDAAFVEGRDQVLRAVAAALGVPHQLIGAESENLSAAARLVEQTLAPYAGLLEGSFDAQLVPKFYADNATGGRIFCKLLRPITVTDAGAVETLTTGVRGGWITPNEARGALGMPPQPGGDTLREPQAPRP